MVYDIIKQYICDGCPNVDTCHKDNWFDANEMAYCLEDNLKTQSKIRPEVRWFATHMERKLGQNDHKGGWGNMSVEGLIGLMYHEFLELYQASRHGGCIFDEAIDVANFAMMVADKVGRGGEGDDTTREDTGISEG